MIYHFLCDNCELVKEESASIQDGPPKEVICPECFAPMYQEFGGNFVLKGDGWAGKDLKKTDYCIRQAAEEDEQKQSDVKTKKYHASKVLSERRKGRKHWRKWRDENKAKFKDYKKALKEGIRGE